jgi:ribose transport system permease protein
LLGGLGVGVGAGWLNGFIAIRMRISPLIATLGTFSALTGLGLILTNAYPIYGLTELRWLGLTKVAGVASCVLIMLGLFAVLAVVMSSTVWGVRLTAVGGSSEAARRAGVNVDRYLWGAYIACGACAALAGLVTFGTLTTAEPIVSNNVIFDAITAVALAGVLLSGGRGSLPKVLLGALILGTIQNGLTLLTVPSYYQLLTTGVLLILAVWIEGALSRAIERRRTMAVTTPDTPTA